MAENVKQVRRYALRLLLIAILVFAMVQIYLLASGWYTESVELSVQSGIETEWNSRFKQLALEDDDGLKLKRLGIGDTDDYYYMDYTFIVDECVVSYELQFSVQINRGYATIEVYKIPYNPRLEDRITDPAEYELVEELEINVTGDYILDCTDYDRNVWYGYRITTDMDSDYEVDMHDYGEVPRWRMCLSDLRDQHTWLRWLPIDSIQPDGAAVVD